MKKPQSSNKKCYCLYLQCLCCWYVKYNFYPPDRTVTYIMRYFTSCWKIPSSSFSHPISYCSEMHAAVCTKYLQLKCPQLFPLLMVNLCYETYNVCYTIIHYIYKVSRMDMSRLKEFWMRTLINVSFPFGKIHQERGRERESIIWKLIQLFLHSIAQNFGRRHLRV